MQKFKILVTILLATVAVSVFAVGSTSGESPELSSSIAADTIWIGDQTEFSIDIKKDISTEVGLPQFKDNKLTDKIEIIAGPRVDTISSEGREVSLSIKYTITVFDAGDYVLQGFPVLVGKDTLRTQTVNRLFVKTFEIDTTKQEIFDIKENLDTPITWEEVKAFIFSWKGGAVLGIFALIAAIVWVTIWLDRRRNGRTANMPKEPAHITALRALYALEKKKMWETGKIKEYYSVLTDIVRNYIEGRYGVSTMELTSPEILGAVKDLNSEKQYRLLEQLLTEADLVKFAKMVPSPEDNIQHLVDAREYVEETKLIIIEEEEGNGQK